MGERLSQWWAARQQTTDQVEARYGVKPDQVQPLAREPLTTNQHILWLLVTVFTGGLGGIGWFVRARTGNRTA